MKVKFKVKWFGPTDFTGGGFISTSGQRFRAGQVYNIPEDLLPQLPKDVIIIDGPTAGAVWVNVSTGATAHTPA